MGQQERDGDDESGDPVSPDIWWARWRDVDYSWEGLANKSWLGWSIADDGTPVPTPDAAPGCRRATLQDYWRAEEPYLVDDPAEMERRRWSRLHLPMRFANGDAAKAKWADGDWEALECVLAERLTAAEATEFDRGLLPTGADLRAQLQGAVLRGLPTDVGAFSLTACGAAFLNDVDWSKRTFRVGTDFSGALFAGSAKLEHATFTGVAFFRQALFCEAANFEYVMFDAEASFTNARFNRTADFIGTTFSESTSFRLARFDGRTQFFWAAFGKGADFHCAGFASEASFYAVTFGGVAVFLETRFGGQADFQTMTVAGRFRFEAQIAAPERDFSGAFFGARFHGPADFTGSGTRLVAAFHQAQFAQGLAMDDPGEARAEHEFRANILPFVRNAARERAADVDFLPELDRRLSELEGGCRNIKAAMGAARDEVREQRYYRFQLRSRRLRSSTPLSEKIFSHVYGYASSYGSSLLRPLIGLALLIASFSVIYAVWASALPPQSCARHGPPPPVSGAARGRPIELAKAGGNCRAEDSLVQAAIFSFSRTFPIGLWPGDSTRWPWRDRLLSETAYAGGAVRMVATFQAISAGALIFLFLLAVRRRFQAG